MVCLQNANFLFGSEDEKINQTQFLFWKSATFRETGKQNIIVQCDALRLRRTSCMYNEGSDHPPSSTVGEGKRDERLPEGRKLELTVEELVSNSQKRAWMDEY